MTIFLKNTISGVESNCCSYRGPWVGSQYPHDSSELPVTLLVLGQPMPCSSSTGVYCMRVVYMYSCKFTETHTHQQACKSTLLSRPQKSRSDCLPILSSRKHIHIAKSLNNKKNPISSISFQGCRNSMSNIFNIKQACKILL